MLGKKTYIANIFIPLILGTIIYFIFRPDTYISIYLSQAFESIGWNVKSVDGFNNPAVDLLRNFGCDILWAYSLVFAVHYFTDKSIGSLFRVSLLCFGFDIAIEIFQCAGIIYGTFDAIDVIVEAAAIFAAVGVIYYICKGEKQHEEEMDS